MLTLRAFRLGLPRAMDQWHVVSDGIGGGAGLYGWEGADGLDPLGSYLHLHVMSCTAMRVEVPA